MASEAETAATAAIEAAIEQYRAAYKASHPEAEFGILGDWIIVAAETVPDMEDSDNDRTAYSVMMTRGGIAGYRALGLLETGKRYVSMEND